MAERIQTEIVGGVLRIRLVNPSGGNAIDLAFGTELEAAVALTGPDVQVVTVTAEGKNFCVGGNVRDFATAGAPGEHIAVVADALHRGLAALDALDVPVIVGVQGWAAGAGMSMALAADVVLLEKSAQLRTAYTGIGLTPDGGMSWTLPRVVGHARAMDLLLTNRPVAADEALAAGIASRLVDDGTVHAAVDALATQLAAGPAQAHRTVKELVRASRGRTYVEQLPFETASISSQAGGPEGREGMASFLERRPADFTTGR